MRELTELGKKYMDLRGVKEPGTLTDILWEMREAIKEAIVWPLYSGERDKDGFPLLSKVEPYEAMMRPEEEVPTDGVSMPWYNMPRIERLFGVEPGDLHEFHMREYDHGHISSVEFEGITYDYDTLA